MITCPECGSKNTQVYSTEPGWNKNHNSYKRYRRCLVCEKRFTTIEQNSSDVKAYVDDVKRELTEMRMAMNCPNTDYKIGYLSAVSYLEGCIAKYELDKG